MIKDIIIDGSVFEWTQGGNVPGGHYCRHMPGKSKAFVPQMAECNSISLLYSDVVIDIGSFLGTYALRCARFPVKLVEAYEPTPMSVEVMSYYQNRNLNVHQAAIVGDDRKSVNLHLSDGMGVTNSIKKSFRKASSLKVKAINYETAVRDATIVKIDVEGAEYDFQIVQPQLRALIIDFHPVSDIDWKKRARAIIEHMHDDGFKTVREPKFDKGWTANGSWLKHSNPADDCNEDLMQGRFCTGCGCKTIPVGHKALCFRCFQQWLPKHRVGFRKTQRVRDID